MTTETLDELGKQTLDLIGKRAASGDIGAIQQLSNTATTIDKFRQQLMEIDRGVQGIRGFLDGFDRGQNGKGASRPFSLTQQSFPGSRIEPKRGAKKLRVEIDWELVGGKKGEKETIDESLSSITITRFLQRLSDVFGKAVLVKLASFKISRGPLVSMEPASDFFNHAAGNVYAHHRIPETDFFVLTNTSTAEKVSDLREACKFLGFPFRFATFSEVAK